MSTRENASIQPVVRPRPVAGGPYIRSSARPVVSPAPTPRIIVQAHPDHADERARLKAGLLAPEARIDPKYFYDAQGCALYGAICALDEYYPTRTEAAIFEANGAAIARCLPAGGQWIDLGCGDGAKSRPWVRRARARRFIGVDYAHGWLEAALDAMADAHRRVECLGVVADFCGPLALHPVIGERPDWPPIFFYPGSSIGNFTRPDALKFLQAIRAHIDAEGCLLIGADLVKDRATLEAAYDDALGVTAAFNRNVLRVANRQLEADFEPDRFDHEACFNVADGRIEMRLRARIAHEVCIGNAVRPFARGEAILTEYSHKYTEAGFATLLAQAGFGRCRMWTDDQRWFGVFLAQA